MGKGTFILVMLVIIVLGLAVIFLLLPGTMKNESNIVDYRSLRAELATVEKGDFIQFKGEWHVVTLVHHMNLNKQDIIFARPNGGEGVRIHYKLDSYAAQIDRIVCWKDPDHAFDHSNWTAAAREFLLDGR